MSAVEILERARDVIADESHWTTKYGARNKKKRRCAPRSRGAVCWCALGALDIAFEPKTPEDWDAFTAARVSLEVAAAPLTIIEINDHKGHAATLAMFDRAIAAVRSERTP